MKKKLLVILLLFYAVTCINTKEVSAAKEKFIIEDGKVLTKYTGRKKVVKVPYGVTEIEEAFKNNKHIEKIILPSSVKYIDADSFYNLKNLKRVKFSKNLIFIEGDAFYKCPNIKKIIIPKKCKSISPYAFKGCTGLKKITVKKGNKYYKVKKDALYTKDMRKIILYPIGCRKYKTYIIPKSVELISDLAFFENKFIEKLIVKGDVFDGGDEGGGCEGMKRLKTVEYRTPQTSPDNGLCFANCKKLEKVVLAEGTKSIGYKQFAGCINLTTINFPDSLESIADNAFEGCEKLVLPEFDESKIRHIDY